MSGDRNLVLAMACLLLTAMLGLWLRPLLPIDETRYLAVAWEMHLSGNWLVPTKNFALYSDKPPLLFWTINLVWLLAGVSDFAARLVGPLSGCVALWLTAVLGRRLWPAQPGIGGRAGLALAGLIVFGMSASLTMFDVPLAVFTLLGLIALSDAGQAGARRGPWLLFGAAMALGVLTKGPVILFHLLPAALLLPAWSAAPMAWQNLARGLGLGLLVAIGLLALWLLPAVTIGGPEYRAAILWHQSAGRLAQSFAHAKPWWFYLALLPGFGFPLFWSPGLWRGLPGGASVADRGLRLCLIWFAGALILFSLTSGKQVHYLVPELPALALIAARVSRRVPDFALLPAIALLGLGAVAALLVAAGLIPAGPAAPLLAPRPALLAGVLPIAAACILAARKRGVLGAMALALGVLVAANVVIGATGLSKAYDSGSIAARIAPHEPDGLAFLGAEYHAQFNFAGRLTRPVAVLDGDAAVRDWIAAHPQGVLFGRVDEGDPGWPPRETINFRGRDWGIWSVSDAAAPQQKDVQA